MNDDNSLKNERLAPLANKLMAGILERTGSIKHDTNKADWSLMPFDALEEINKVLEFGANKYSAYNWAEGGFKYTRVLSALLRHTFAFMRGEDNDPESGLSHIAHVGCNVLFLLHYIKNKDMYAKNDDRRVSNERISD